MLTDYWTPWGKEEWAGTFFKKLYL